MDARLTSSSVGVLSSCLQRAGWWVDPQTGQGSPGFSPAARIPAWPARKLWKSWLALSDDWPAVSIFSVLSASRPGSLPFSFSSFSFLFLRSSRSWARSPILFSRPSAEASAASAGRRTSISFLSRPASSDLCRIVSAPFLALRPRSSAPVRSDFSRSRAFCRSRIRSRTDSRSFRSCSFAASLSSVPFRPSCSCLSCSVVVLYSRISFCRACSFSCRVSACLSAASASPILSRSTFVRA